ncbi:hypothetical protein C8J56DRAFT_1061728 [Mycena floridula]|nr:hypothetical protein C8J56DRAFT_1061728 [Mycena floridula]
MRSPTLLVALLGIASTATPSVFATDPCAAIGGKEWVAPQDLRACFKSFKVDPVIKQNIVDVINKTLAFHTSVNYELKAPEPFTAAVHEDLLGDLARISHQSYPSDYDLHIDFSRTLKRLNDGHCVWINACYDCQSLFLNFLPTPLALLTDSKGVQSVHIVPEAFAVASAEFADEIAVWQNALPGPLKGKLESLNGAKVLAIDGQDPWVAINANALITGSFQGLGTRQNGFFASYQRSTTTWNYVMGNFAQQSLPLSDSVNLKLVLNNTIAPLPYRVRIGAATVNFTDSASYRANNCVPIAGTNGIDVYADKTEGLSDSSESKVVAKFQQQPATKVSMRHAVNVMLDTTPLSDVVLPPTLQPPATPVDGSFGVGTFYMQPDGKTGVLALGSFSGADFEVMESGLLQGLLTLKSMGATQLIVDVSNNGGGFICIAHWLHRIIIGPKDTTTPQAGLFTTTRDGPLAQLIVQQIVQNNADPDAQLLYNPLQWRSFNGTPFGATEDWLQPPVAKVINGRKDAFSQELGQECQPFDMAPPEVPLFNASSVVIVNNGRCASSCSLFTITMSKEEGVKTVVIGGKSDVKQEYCGTVGGQSTDFVTIDTEIKTTHLKNNTLAPPDLLVNGVQGITWRLGFGIQNTAEPEEWQDHPATLNLHLTPDLVNNPTAIWTTITDKLLS